MPIRLLHDRWIGKFAEPIVGSMASLKRALEAPMDRVDHAYSVLIKATPERVWQAITTAYDTAAYYYGTRVRSTFEIGASIAYDYSDGSLAADGEILEIEPGRRLVMSFHPRWEPAESEGPVHMTWAIDADPDGGPTRLTVTSAIIPGSATEAEFKDGVVYILSGLKTYLETGAPLVAA